ncbi:Post-GPI attachment to proteins factor 3 [Chamberlinius hualienensis]
MEISKRLFLCLLLLGIGGRFIRVVEASIGDQSTHYRQCLDHLEDTVCKNQTRTVEMRAKQPISQWLTGWTCLDECRYHCMWATVKQFVNRELPIPQFHGKWPFIRLLGMQEPASVIFSLLNALSLYIMWRKFTREVPSSAPTYYVWQAYAVLGIHTWLWSAIFHTRDTQLTELLDYLCAMFSVLFTFFGLCNRLFFRKSKLLVALCGILCLVIFIRHAHYLAFVHFDYQYHLRISVAIGFINSVGWLLWCAFRWKKQPYVWKCCTVVVAVNCLLTLELLDFPPIMWTFDAHSLWHLGTAPIPIMWFNFLIEDCLYMLKTTD